MSLVRDESGGAHATALTEQQEATTAVGHLALCSVVSDLDGVFEHLVLA